ncbi:Murein hydrolase activator EnvC [hydrothermal vent metagenome]|uniref:Murein hydrolase activator EnvC n=1 Tax=hydrothermal vent metagenome TaxID=652676 RepID=A0A3B0WMY0_9ZZZZ
MLRIKLPTNRTKLKAIIPIFLFLSLFFTFNATFASKNEDMSHYQGKLEKLQKSIKKVQQHLKGTKKQRSHVVTELKTLEAEISKNAKKLKRLEKDVQHNRKQEKKLKKDLKQLNKQLGEQRTILSEQIRSAYSIGHQQNLKMLLNQQDPAQAGRTQAYFNYLNRARQQQIDSFLATFDLKKQTETDLQQTLLTQHDLLKTQKKRKRQRQNQRFQRKQLLTELSKKIENQETTLTSLESSRGRIENLLKSLGELLADIPSSPSENKPFLTQKGKLPWPVKGRFMSKFGQSKNYGDLKWNGVLIKAKLGTPVRAVSHGRVAFSDWLQGFGFIIIIDHGDGYMSLYGQNESLFKQTGDWVQSGEVIATAGDSGGQPISGVYFEIRARGKPVNPSRWCSSKIKHTSASML